jgi:hypothetical protein
MTVVRRDGATWVAARDGLAHGTADRELRAFCGAMPTAPRYAWPIREMCAVCLVIEHGQAAKRKEARIA